MNTTGHYFFSKFKSSEGPGFGTSERGKEGANGKISNQHFLNYIDVPGPGSYTMPSEFGVYDLPAHLAKKKFLKPTGEVSNEV